MTDLELHPGTVAWATLSPSTGSEQAGRRPVVVIANEPYLEAVDRLAIIVPVSSVARGWPNHVEVVGETGMSEQCWAMTEQVRTISRQRLHSVSGRVTPDCLRDIRDWVYRSFAEV